MQDLTSVVAQGVLGHAPHFDLFRTMAGPQLQLLSPGLQGRQLTTL
jgi:hypothetical protein